MTRRNKHTECVHFTPCVTWPASIETQLGSTQLPSPWLALTAAPTHPSTKTRIVGGSKREHYDAWGTQSNWHLMFVLILSSVELLSILTGPSSCWRRVCHTRQPICWWCCSHVVRLVWHSDRMNVNQRDTPTHFYAVNVNDWIRLSTMNVRRTEQNRFTRPQAQPHLLPDNWEVLILVLLCMHRWFSVSELTNECNTCCTAKAVDQPLYVSGVLKICRCVTIGHR